MAGLDGHTVLDNNILARDSRVPWKQQERRKGTSRESRSLIASLASPPRARSIFNIGQCGAAPAAAAGEEIDVHLPGLLGSQQQTERKNKTTIRDSIHGKMDDVACPLFRGHIMQIIGTPDTHCTSGRAHLEALEGLIRHC